MISRCISPPLRVSRGAATALPLVVAIVGLSLGRVSAADLEIESFQWGYDGRVVAPAFNPLTVVLHNPGDDEVSGVLELQRLRGSYWPVGLPIRLSVFLSPGARRPVRFYPYVLGDYDNWRLNWIDPDGGRRELNTAAWKLRLGEPATVLLDGSDRLTGRGGRLRRLDESWFPSVSTATDGLDGVVLDHVPRWEALRRRAFLEWLGRGGTLHLLEAPDGRRVVFGGELKVLNGNSALARYGAGRVIRQPFGIEEIPDGFPVPATRKQRNVSVQPMTMYGFDPFGSIDDAALFSTLRSMTRPRRNWPLIYLACLVYMVVLFPGGFAYGQGERDYRAVLALLVTTVGLFSVIFFLVGRRDDAARLTIRTATVAHHMANGDLEYNQWVEAAVTHGGNYRFTHQGRARLYSTAQNLEKVVGSIEHGGDAALTVDVPPYSSSTFLVRGRLPGGSIGLSLVDLQATGGQLQSLSLSTGEGFPSTTRQAAVLIGGRFYSLVRRDGLLQLDRSTGNMSRPGYRGDGRLTQSFDPEFDRYRELDEAFDSMFEALLLRSLGLTDRAVAANFSLPPGQIRVFVYAPTSDPLLVQIDEPADQVGFVLYTWDFQAAAVP